MCAAPNIGYWLQYQAGLPPGSAFDPATESITLRGILNDPDTPQASLRVWARLYDAAGRFIWSREMAAAGGDLWQYTLNYQPAGSNRKLIVQFGGSPSGGSFVLQLNGVNTAPIGYNDTTGRKAQIISEHPDVGPGNVTCAWNSTTKTLTVEFVNDRAHMEFVAELGISNSLTGSNPTVSVTKSGGVGDLPSRQGRYSWDIVGFDGRWSGNVGGYNSRNGIGPEKAELWLDMAPGVATTSPADAATITTPTPTLSWTYASGTIVAIPVTSAVVTVLDSSGNRVYQATDTQRRDAVTVPLSAGLQNGGVYTWTLDVTKASGRTVSVSRTFTVSYTRPAALAYTGGAGPERIGFTHAVTGVSAANFVAYVMKVRPVGAAEDGPQNVEVWRDTNRDSGFGYVLRFPRNRDFILSFYVVQLQFGSEVYSLPYEQTFHVKLDSLIVVNPVDHSYVLLKTHRGRDHGPISDTIYTERWGGATTLFHPPANRDELINATVTEAFSFEPVIYDRLMEMFVNPQLTPYVVSDALGHCWEAAVNRPHQSIAGGHKALEIDVSFRTLSPSWFGAS